MFRQGGSVLYRAAGKEFRSAQAKDIAFGMKGLPLLALGEAFSCCSIHGIVYVGIEGSRWRIMPTCVPVQGDDFE